MGWLDEHIGQIGSVFERTFGPQDGGHKRSFLRTVEASLNFVPEEAGPESGKRFEIDLLPFVHPALETISSRINLDSHRIEHMKCVDLDERNQQLLSDHFTRTGFNYIEFPRDRFRIAPSTA